MTTPTDHPPEVPPCNARYPGSEQRGARIVRCDLPYDHPGDHCETDTESTWPPADPCQTVGTAGEPLCMRRVDQEPCDTCPDEAPDPPAEALDIRPGDTLIVRIPTGTRHDTAERMDRGLSQRLPGVNVVILAADGMARYRPDQTAVKE